ncbi:hypothetical protein ABOM_000295 [Aspergillus bombycis]|uniref:S-adenosyl-L-methionine-dependent methyltransferase n=1 Tax=Aspergillus bombycis TaxID=109264 RepID=A0A1F8AHA7_9EURO|nr:hypothetical protein ABOM_000295 [Aspergillus bombycis]OGM51067.1 hypothetical protein ABOM_000295 [Aspergillus bombycis]
MTEYLGPSDEQESDRPDMLHEVLLVKMNRKLFLAPIESSPERVLDLGAGTGLWVMDYADNSPSAEAVGMHLSPIQPQFVPPNAMFLVDDFEDDWIYQDQFDLIHSRYLAGAMKNRPRLMTQAYRLSLLPSHNVIPWLNSAGTRSLGYGLSFRTGMSTCIQKMGRPRNPTRWFVAVSPRPGFMVSPGPHLGEWLQEAGFEEVHVKKYRAPVGGWPKDTKPSGFWNLLQAETGFEEVNMLVSGAKKDVQNPTVHTVAGV